MSGLALQSNIHNFLPTLNKVSKAGAQTLKNHVEITRRGEPYGERKQWSNEWSTCCLFLREPKLGSEVRGPVPTLLKLKRHVPFCFHVVRSRGSNFPCLLTFRHVRFLVHPNRLLSTKVSMFGLGAIPFTFNEFKEVLRGRVRKLMWIEFHFWAASSITRFRNT